jgi:E3 ubiquitin-protein ligase TRIP12
LNNMKLTFNGLDVKLEDLSLNFTLPGHPDIELKPQGSDTEVNLDNL